MTQAYPIQWPRGRARTKNRGDSRFKVKPTKAFDEMDVTEVASRSAARPEITA